MAVAWQVDYDCEHALPLLSLEELNEAYARLYERYNCLV